MKCNCKKCKGKEVEVLLYETKVFLDDASVAGEKGDSTFMNVSFATTGAVTMRLKELITGEIFGGQESSLDDAIMDAFIAKLKVMEEDYLDKVTNLITKTVGDYSAMKYVAKELTGGLN